MNATVIYLYSGQVETLVGPKQVVTAQVTTHKLDLEGGGGSLEVAQPKTSRSNDYRRTPAINHSAPITDLGFDDSGSLLRFITTIPAFMSETVSILLECSE